MAMVAGLSAHPALLWIWAANRGPFYNQGGTHGMKQRSCWTLKARRRPFRLEPPRLTCMNRTDTHPQRPDQSAYARRNPLIRLTN
jgi:hypothetical protein